jgi:predicted metalloprotease with PDZ domain
MKKISIALFSLFILAACKSQKTSSEITKNEHNTIIDIDLINIVDDKVRVEMTPIKFTNNIVTFNIPKTVPGTYSTDNYGKYIENLKALDVYGDELNVTHPDENSWIIKNANKINKIIYFVNDTFDTETTHDVFSPAGTNILSGKNFMLNLHGFVGYFKEHQELPYTINITHPSDLIGNTALTDSNIANDKDTFFTKRYFEVTDSPIMYAPENNASFKIGNMEILLSVYSPNNIVKATDLKVEMEKMMLAQKEFLGDVNATKKYCILLYMSDGKEDATGFGALEHHTSTTVVFPEMMPAEYLSKSMKDVVSHEFFHILTPLSVHSEEVHNFDYNNPKMSQHLWMYEGVTEYFANLFQINQGLINENEFYERVLGKVNGAKRFNDTMSFTKMSTNILNEPYKSNYINVYEKGALIGMCIDIIIREKSNGKEGILDMMKKLSNKYGVNKPFIDNILFDDITSLTYPEVQTFINNHVAGNTPIDYKVFFDKLGLKIQSKETKTGYLLKDMQTPYIDVDQKTKEILFINKTNTFLTSLGIKPKDRLVSINDTKYNLENIQALVEASFAWTSGSAIKMVIKRDGKEIILKGKVIEPMGKTYNLISDELPDTDKRLILRNAWMKG